MDSSQCGDEDGLLSGDEVRPHADVDDDDASELEAWARLGEKLAAAAPAAMASVLDALEFAVAAMGEDRCDTQPTYETYN